MKTYTFTENCTADDFRISDQAEYGRSIGLTCKNHPTLSWSTKNIDYIGARTIFFNLEGIPGMVECDCPWSALRVITGESDHE